MRPLHATEWGMKRNGDKTGKGERETIVGVEVGVEVGNWKSLIGR